MAGTPSLKMSSVLRGGAHAVDKHKKAEAELARAGRWLSWAWLSLLLLHQAYDGQAASGHATGLENGQESAYSWPGDRNR